MEVGFLVCSRQTSNLTVYPPLPLGSSVAKFSGENVHKRLTNESAYYEKQYELALKRAFLGTDDDIRAGA